MTKTSARPSTPRTISLAIWVISALLAMIGGLALAIGGGTAEFAGIDMVDGESTAVLTATGIVVLVLNLIMIFIAMRMWRGSMVAQWILTVIGAVSLVTLQAGAGQGMVVWLHTIAVIIAIVLMWVPSTQNTAR